MFAFLSLIPSFLLGSVFNVHTYVGVFLGACFAPLWVKIWAWLSAQIVKMFPKAAPIIADVNVVANDVVKVVTPVANDINAVVTPPAGPSATKH